MDMEKNLSADPVHNENEQVNIENTADVTPPATESTVEPNASAASADGQELEPPMPLQESEIDFTVKYSDESYDAFIENFKQNKKRRLFYFVKQH